MTSCPSLRLSAAEALIRQKATSYKCQFSRPFGLRPKRFVRGTYTRGHYAILRIHFFASYRMAQKIGTISLYALTLPNISRFSKLFHCHNQAKICNNTITKDTTTAQVCRYTTLWNVKCFLEQQLKTKPFL